MPQHEVFRFRLLHLMYVVTLLGTSFGVFGVEGLLPGSIVVALWWTVAAYWWRPRWLVMGAALAALCAAFLLPVQHSTLRYPPHLACPWKMKTLTLALHNYHDDYGCFPPAFVPDQNGKPMHSWRVLILPYMEELPLYEQYRWNEPWNGPNNSRLLNKMPEWYSCSQQRTSGGGTNATTSFLAVVGPDTAWPGAVGKKLNEFIGSTADAVVLIEVAGHGVSWMEPRDLTLSEALDIVTQPDNKNSGGHRFAQVRHASSKGRFIALADGSVHPVLDGVLTREPWIRLFCTNDLPVENSRRLLQTGWPPQRSEFTSQVLVAAWIAVALLPLPWGHFSRRSTGKGDDHERVTEHPVSGTAG